MLQQRFVSLSNKMPYHKILCDRKSGRFNYRTGTSAAIVLFHNDFPSSGEQSQQHVLTHRLWQPTSGFIAIFYGGL